MKRDSSFEVFEKELSKPHYINGVSGCFRVFLAIIGVLFSFLGILLLHSGTFPGNIISVAFGAVCFSVIVIINCFFCYQTSTCPYCYRIIDVQRAKRRFKCPYCKRKIIKVKNVIENTEPRTNETQQETTNNEPSVTAENMTAVTVEPQDLSKPNLPKLSLNYMRDDFFREWEWKSQCNSEQRIRLERAKTSVIFDLFDVDRDRGTASCFSSKYESTGEVYEVTYKSCTCRDFMYRFYPCKHIYALNIRLGIISRDEELDGVPQSIKDKISLLELGSAARFKKILLEHKTKSSVPFPLKITKVNKMLLDTGLLVESGSETKKLLDIVFTRNDLVAKIYENGLDYKPKSKDKKEEIINYIVDNEPRFAKKIIKNNVMVSFSEEILDNFTAVFLYYTK